MPEYLQDITASVVPNNGFFSSEQQDGRAYGRYNIRQHFVTHHGLLQLPTAGPVGSPARMVRVHAPYSIKVITWVVYKLCELGEKPILPHWDTGDTNEVCTIAEVRIDSPTIAENGQAFHWRVHGEYHYASGQAGRSQMSGGSSPAITLPPESFGINEGDFSKDFLRAVGGSIKGGGVAFAGLVFDSALV